VTLMAENDSQNTSFGSCFWSFYVKWLEQGGARVAVIRYDETPEKLEELFQSINGLLFTGGEINLFFNSSYVQTANTLYHMALKANQNGDYFPVWGTCLGFELICMLESQDQNILSRNTFDSDGLSLALDMTPNALEGRVFGRGNCPTEVYDILTHQNITENLHVAGVFPKNFTGNKQLNGFFNILSTNVDRKGKPFVSTIEGKVYPVYATQWHPERPQYAWETGIGLVHSFDSATSMQYMSNFFVQETRKNFHKFTNQTKENDALIYSYSPVNMGNGVQIYYFDSAN